MDTGSHECRVSGIYFEEITSSTLKMNKWQKLSDTDIFLSEWVLPGYYVVFVERWEGEDAFYDVHRRTGYYRKSKGKEGLQPFGEWKLDPGLVETIKA